MPQELEDLQTSLGYSLPSAYLRFLAETNGAEWCIHNGNAGECLAMWQVNEIIAMSQGYQIQRWLPRVLAIGSDSGGDAIAFDRSSLFHPDSWPVARVGFGDLEADEMILQANSLVDWVSNEFRLIKSDSQRSTSAGEKSWQP